MHSSVTRYELRLDGTAVPWRRCGPTISRPFRFGRLLAGLPHTVPGATVNRLCASGLEAVGQAARAIRSGEADLLIAGGVESMTRAPFVIGKADLAFSRGIKLEDTTLGWRFVNPAMKARYGVDSMPETRRERR
jgi:acetyl-CoA acetyltransferase